MSDDIEFASAALVLRPGDTLIVATNRPLPLDGADDFRGRLRSRIPGLADVVLITNVAALAAYRPDAEEGASDA